MDPVAQAPEAAVVGLVFSGDDLRAIKGKQSPGGGSRQAGSRAA